MRPRLNHLPFEACSEAQRGEQHASPTECRAECGRAEVSSYVQAACGRVEDGQRLVRRVRTDDGTRGRRERFTN